MLILLFVILLMILYVKRKEAGLCEPASFLVCSHERVVFDWDFILVIYKPDDQFDFLLFLLITSSVVIPSAARMRRRI